MRTEAIPYHSRKFPAVDRIELVFSREECELTIPIDLTTDTGVDLAFPDGVIQLRGPIVVPPCDPVP